MRTRLPSSLSLLAFVAVASFLLALGLGASNTLMPMAAAHVAFAVGIVPLIFGAMLHFVPVLTRGSSPHRLIAALPFVAQLVGVLVVCILQGLLPRWLLHLAATLDLALALVLAIWMLLRARRALGAPHPGWRWYAASLAMLVLALVAVPPLAVGLAPVALRNFHLHLNTFGFIGLAALGTLPVLLPTALGRPDTQAAHWLRRRLPVALAGILTLAVGAALATPVAIVGSAFLAVVALGLLAHWGRSFGWKILLSDGAAAPLAAATGFYGLLQLAGVGHGLRVTSPDGLVAAFAAGFLFPLVTGALTQLLPVWRHPGPQTPVRLEMRRRLARFGGLRALLLPAAGVLLVMRLAPAGAVLAGVALLLFVADLVSALRAEAPAR